MPPRIRSQLLFFGVAMLTWSMSAVPVRAQTVSPCTVPAQTDPTTTTPTSQTQNTTPITPPSPPRIMLNELLPNPVGVDTDGEFIEIRNGEQSAVDITGWKLTDDKGKSFVFLNTQIGANSYVSLPYATTKLTLVNTNATISLFDTNNTQIDQVAYSNPKEGESYARDSSRNWRWTGQLTPGTENIFPVSATPSTPSTPTTETTAETITPTDSTSPTTPTNISPSSSSPSSTTGSESTTSPPSSTVPSSSSSPPPATNCPCATTTNITASISDINDLDAGTPVEVQGIVSLPPGVIGNTTFAIQDDDAANGMLIKNWTGPTIAQGMTILVRGKIRKSNTATWIALDKNGTRIVSKKFALPENAQSLGDIDEKSALVYTTLNGVVAKTNKAWLTLSDNQSTELRVRYATAFTTTLAQGNRVDVRGVVRMRGTTPEILVLNPKSIVLEPIKPVPSDVVSPAMDTRESITAQPSTDYTPYLFYGATFLLMLAGILGYTYWKKKYRPHAGAHSLREELSD